MRSKGTAEELEARRKRAIDLLQKGWAPRDVADALGVVTKPFMPGKPCVLKAWDRHDRLTAIAAITLLPCQGKSTLHFSLQAANAKAEDLLMFLLKLHKELKTKLIVVWDRLGPIAGQNDSFESANAHGFPLSTCQPTVRSYTQSNTFGQQ